MKLTNKFLNAFFIVMAFVIQASERGVKRKYKPSSHDQQRVIEDPVALYREKVRAAWNTCRLSDLPASTNTEDELIPGFYATVHHEAQELFPDHIRSMIIEYCTRHTLQATAQRWDLEKLNDKLGLSSFNTSFDLPFGLVKIDQKYLYISAHHTLGRLTFKVPLTKNGAVSYSCGLLEPLATGRYVRCGEGILTRAQPGIQLRSLKNGNILAAWNTPQIGRLYAINDQYMVVQLLFHNTQNTKSQIFVINRTSATIPVSLKNRATQPLSIFCNAPDNVLLCQPIDTENPWVVVFHLVRVDERRYKPVMDIFEVTQGKRLKRIIHPGRLLHVHKDDQSIVCVRKTITMDPEKLSRIDSKEFSHVARYAIPSGKIISQCYLTTFIDAPTPIKDFTYVMSAYVVSTQSKKLNNTALGIHPAYGRLLTLAHGIDNYSIQQNVADEQGNYIAAIMENMKTNKQQLIVWHVT